MSFACTICKNKTRRIEKHFRKRASSRFYRLCTECEFISLEDHFMLSSDEEFNVYERHENSIDDPKYVEFFMKFIKNAIVDYIDNKDLKCLDFGSGPEPVLAALLEREFNCSVDIYDKFYATKKVYEGNKYDLVTSTEVIEHLYDPMHYFCLFKNLLNPGGILSIMTLFHPANNEQFSKWMYTSDPSHISFYTPKTMRTIADKAGLNILYCDDCRYITLNINRESLYD